MAMRVQVKGGDFGQDGKETPKDDLLRMPGLFKLKDVEDRIPMGDIRSLVYVDLELLGAEFQSQWEKSRKG